MLAVTHRLHSSVVRCPRHTNLKTGKSGVAFSTKTQKTDQKMSNLMRMLTADRVSKTTYSESEINNAKTDLTLDNALMGAEVLEEFSFEDKTKEILEKLGKCSNLEIVVREDKNGNEFNKIVGTFEKGKKEFSVFGKRDKNSVLASQNLTAEQINKVKFGYCVQGDEIKTSPKIQPDGTLVKVIRLYCNLCNQM